MWAGGISHQPTSRFTSKHAQTHVSHRKCESDAAKRRPRRMWLSRLGMWLILARHVVAAVGVVALAGYTAGHGREKCWHSG